LRLGELRLTENVRQPQDRRVLEAYPQLADLLRSPDEPVVTGPTDPSLVDRLGRAGWRGQRLDAPYVYTAGRVYVSNSAIHRGRRLRVDALLRAERSLPIAVAQLLRPREGEGEALLRLEGLARERLGVPFAYLVHPGGGITEIDRPEGAESRRSSLTEFPAPAVLLDRWLTALHLDDDQARDALCFPYEVRPGQPLRYYQELAINRGVAAVLQARRDRRLPRVLITQATGTGKTKVAFQIVWKLKQVKAVKNVLFITDRDWLLTQAMDNEFAPFRDARARIRGELGTAKDIFFATYQALAGAEGRDALYRRYPRNYFDLVLIDECHRGSAQDDSNWRTLLEYFDRAAQIGMTATPLRTDNVDTYAYFGQPAAVYSLRQGINDGFLAPYRVRRVLMRGVDDPEGAEGGASPPLPALSEEERGELEAAVVAAAALVNRTEAIAAHLANFLRITDPLAKTIVFCVDQAHADRMRQALERELHDRVEEFSRRGDTYVERVVAEEGGEGRRTLGRFSDPEQGSPVVVTTSRLLTTGVDVPTCKNIVLARPVNSMVEFKQIIGRGTRLLEPRKSWFTIVDYAGATKHFYDEEWDGDPQFVDLDALLPAVPPVVVPAVPTGAGNGGGSLPIAPAVAPGPQTPAPSPPGAPPPVVVSEGAAPLQTPTAIGARPATTLGTPSAGAGFVPNGSAGPPPGGPSPGGTPVDSPEPGPSAPVSPGDAVTLGAGPVMPALVTPGPAVPGTPVSTTGATGTPPMPGAESRTRRRDGRRIAVVGEVLYELGPDGLTLREIPYVEYAREAIGGECPTLEALRERWLNPDLRRELEGRLEDDGVDLTELAAVFNLAECDPLDVLAHALFRTPVPSRQDRVTRLRERHSDWLESFPAEAREILDVILRKFSAGEAPEVTRCRSPRCQSSGGSSRGSTDWRGGSTRRSDSANLQPQKSDPFFRPRGGISSERNQKPTGFR
jgi:superfamily II DNA or RNA helicase